MAKTVTLRGKFKWVRAHQPDEIYNKWTVTLYPDDASLKIIHEWMAKGLKNLLRQDEDGPHMNFGRPLSRPIGGGKEMKLTAPEIFKADGSRLLDTFVGNGSDGTINVEAYEHKTPRGGKATAVRWVSMTVENLIPYEKSNFNPPDKEEGFP